MDNQGVFVILSGVSGTGKSYLQNLIIKSNNNFKAVNKYYSRPVRNDDNNTTTTNTNTYNVPSETIKKICTWSYKRNGSTYGITESDVISIIRQGKNAITIISDKQILDSIRTYCIEHDIKLLIVHLLDSSITTKNISKTLSSKGRSFEEVSERDKTEKQNIFMDSIDQYYSDYIILNNSNGKHFEKNEDEILNEFNADFIDFTKKKTITNWNS